MVIPKSQGVRVFCDVPRELSGEVFAHLSHEHQEMLIGALSPQQIRAVLTEMSPDDEARVLEGLTPAINRRALASISPNELNAINELLKYPPHSTGRYMTPRYLTIRMDMTAREGLAHVRDKGRGMETVDVLYVLDDDGKLIKDMNLGSLVLADPTATVRDIPGSGVALKAMTDREETLRAFEKYDRFVLPVTDDDGHMLGIVTIDDILDVAAKETTEDLQKLSGLGALDEPYLEVGYLSAIRQRGGWLSILFFGEMLTATAMGFYEKEIAAAVVLRAIRTLDHQQRRQFWLTSGHPCCTFTGTWRLEAARLVSRAGTRAAFKHDARRMAWNARVRSHRPLAATGVGRLWPALSLGWDDSLARLSRRCMFWIRRGQHAPVLTKASRLRPSDEFGALCRHARRRYGADYLLHMRHRDPPRNVIVNSPISCLMARRRTGLRSKYQSHR